MWITQTARLLIRIQDLTQDKILTYHACVEIARPLRAFSGIVSSAKVCGFGKLLLVIDLAESFTFVKLMLISPMLEYLVIEIFPAGVSPVQLN